MVFLFSLTQSVGNRIFEFASGQWLLHLHNLEFQNQYWPASNSSTTTGQNKGEVTSPCGHLTWWRMLLTARLSRFLLLCLATMTLSICRFFHSHTCYQKPRKTQFLSLCLGIWYLSHEVFARRGVTNRPVRVWFVLCSLTGLWYDNDFVHPPFCGNMTPCQTGSKQLSVLLLLLCFHLLFVVGKERSISRKGQSLAINKTQTSLVPLPFR